MKKYYFISGIALAVLLAASPVVTAETSVDVDATVEVDAELNTGDTTTLNGAAKTRERILLEEERRKKMLEENRLGAGRNPLLRNKLMASSTPGERRGADMRNASSSDERREIRRDLRHDIFKIRQMHLVRQLGISIDNLKQIRGRIVSRIEKLEADGKSVTEIKASLTVADTKITAAETAIATLAAYTPPANATASSTTDADVSVDLEKPRQIGETAIKAVKDARRALQDVVVAIAHAMGMGPRTPTATTTVDTDTQVTP